MSKSKCITKRLLAVILTVLMLMSMVTIGITSASAAYVEHVETGATQRTIYLKAGVWDQDGALFKAWIWGGASGNKWINFTDTDGDGIYNAEMDDDYTGMKVLRYSATAHAGNDWGCWNDSGDQTIPNNQNMLVVNDWSSFSWSTYTPADDGGDDDNTGGDTGGTVVADGFPGGTVLYLQPGVWTEANARFAAYFCNGSSAATWIDMTDADGDGYYEVTVPDDSNHKNVIFVRMNPAETENNWVYKWNQTEDLAYVADNNLFSISAWGPDGGNSPGDWSVYEGGSGGGSTVTGTGFWVDTYPEFDANTAVTDVLPIDWLAVSSSDRLYLPSNVDLNAVEFNFLPEDATLTIDGTPVANGGTIKLEENKTYTVGGSFSDTFTVYKSDKVNTMYTYTEKVMPTTKGAYNSKDNYSTNGSIMFLNESGEIKTYYTPKDEEGNKLPKVYGDVALSKIKGRGNSSWKASRDRFEKYAFNITLGEKNVLLDGAEKSKKFCLLANNADESKMRNMVIYSLADTIGVEFVAKFEVVDVYNNNKYIGSYLLTDKVEIGDPLVNLTDANGEEVNLDDINEEFFGEDSEGEAYYGQSQFRASNTGNLNEIHKEGFIKYYDYSRIKADDVDPAKYADSGFLLELELNDRFDDEMSGFISKKGQPVVCKYPEYATKAQMEFIYDKWTKAEDLIYTNNPSYEALDELIDVESFAKMYLIQELSKNLDACSTSFYIYYNEGKLHAGVAWDYDWTLGQYEKDLSGRADGGSNRFTPNGSIGSASGWWANSKEIYKSDQNENYINTDYKNIQAQLCQGDDFWDVVKAEWNEIFYDAAKAYVTDGEVGSVSSLSGIIAEYYDLMQASIDMDETKWSIINDNEILDWGSKDTGKNFDETVVFLNNYIYRRLTWMNNDSQGKLNVADYTIQAPVVTADKDKYTKGDTVTLTITDKSSGSFKYLLNGEEITLTEGKYTTVADTATTAYTVQAVSTTTSVASEEATVNVTVEEETCAHANTEIISAVDATCTETGLTAGEKCTDCGQVLVAQEEVPALGHTEVIDEAVAPNCTETGLTEGKHCSVCNAVIVAQEEVPALGHTEVIDEEVAPGCETTGLTEGKHCSVCNAVIVAQEEIKATGHTPKDVDSKEPTCKEPGFEGGTICDVCGKTLSYSEEIPVLPHTEVIDEAVAPDCVNTGLTEGSHCEVCGEVIVAQEEVPALGHTEVTDEAVAPDCVNTGLTEGSHCDVCGETIVAQEEVPALGHTEVIDEAVAPNCTETGLTEGKHCSVCNAVIVAQETVNALGHTEVIDEAVAPGCETTGLTEGSHCDVCGETIIAQEEVPATGHAWDNGYCTNCGEQNIPAEVTGNSLTLGGNIGVNFFFSITDEEAKADTTYVLFTLPNGSVRRVFFSEDKLTEYGYMFTCEVAAKEMASDVKAKLCTATGASSKEVSCSVMSYADKIINNVENLETYTKAQPLVKAMLNYGAAAQVQFKYNVDSYANSILPEAERSVDKANFAEFEYMLTGKDANVTYYGSRLTLESKTAVKHYFKVKDGVTPEFKIGDVTLEYNLVDGLYEIVITDIIAQNLDEHIVVTVGELTLDYNAFSYGYLVAQTKPDDTALNAVMDAMYAYNQAANDYI